MLKLTNLSGFGVGEGELVTTIAGNQTNYNLFTAAGSPSAPGRFKFIINAGVTIDSSSTSTAALVTGSFPVGSIITIINNGNIYGKGGAGAAGGSSTGTPAAGGTGSAGGPAISISQNVTIDNTNGNIFGGGGGGGGGGGAQSLVNSFVARYGGHGGGSGRGSTATSGGSGGTASGGSHSNTNGTAGGEGNSSGAGTAATGGPHGIGGAGGDWGAAGSSGGAGTGNAGNQGGAGSPGAAGKAIALNSNSVTWLGGNNGTQVKGAQS